MKDYMNSAILPEIKRSEERFGTFHSSHEALGVLIEELEELTMAIRENDRLSVEAEAVQVSAAALRLAHCCWSAKEEFLKRSGMQS